MKDWLPDWLIEEGRIESGLGSTYSGVGGLELA